LPDAATLEQFFSGCYHASLLREEERAVTFRAILAPPELFSFEERPPEGFLRLELSRALPFDPSQLRRLSVAVDPHRTLIGVGSDGHGSLCVWGLIHSGTRWMRGVQGGRRTGASLPPAPVAHVDAPGRLEVYKGQELVGQLQGGSISGCRMDIFESQWLPETFLGFRNEIVARHEAARESARGRGERWAPIEAELPRRIAERLHKRIISLLRDARHGGTLLFVPPASAEATSVEEAYLDIRYGLANGKPRHSFSHLMVDILDRLAHLYGTTGQGEPPPVGWREFEETTDHTIATLDEGLFELAHLLADLAAADGAVVLTKDHEILGFSGMISGRLPDLPAVARALDLEGEEVAVEGTGNVGARHLSAYRLTGALPGSVAIVISQDGGVRFVFQKRGRVTYWEQE
jgi:hypothetical protein